MNERDIKVIDPNDSLATSTSVIGVKIKDFSLPHSMINTLVIREYYYVSVPLMTLTLLDSGMFINFIPLEEDDEISVEISVGSEEDTIRATFYMKNYWIEPLGESTINHNYVHIVGYLKCTDLVSPIKTRSFHKKKSSEVVSQVAKEMGLKVDIRESSRDAMNWLQVSQNNYTFLNDVLKRSYTKNNTTNFVYTTLEGTMVFTNLERELNSKPKYILERDFEKVNNFDENVYIGEGLDKIYYTSKTYENYAFVANVTDGLNATLLKYYKDGVEVTEKIFNREPKLAKNIFRRKDNIGKETKEVFLGHNTSRNFHGNFFKSIVQNDYYTMDFFSNSVVVTTRPRKDLQLFDKVTYKPIVGEDISDDIHSGDYLVSGKVHILGVDTKYAMLVILNRNSDNRKDSIVGKNGIS